MGRSYTSAFLFTCVGMSWGDPDHVVEAKRDENYDYGICLCVLSKDAVSCLDCIAGGR